ncbi:hypothetical protein pipiens_010537 [Culex pipiens pipiens]|uniref:Peptidase A2 domain-containing protein n=1 Tax=Culex pipiens pipiens TaxID=38569 RepID=A0ABD1DAB6_CULPP
MSNPPAPNAQQQGAPAAPVFINSSIPFPEPLSLNGNLRENVELWKESFETYCIASGVEQLPERVQIATFKSALGPSARKIFNLWPLLPADKDTVAKSSCARNPETAPVKQNRCRASSIAQDLEDEMLRDKIITGIRDMSLKKKMIETENLTSAKVIEMCQAEEATRFEMERNRLLGADQHSVNKIAGDRHQNKRCSFCGKAYHTNLLDCPARGATCNYCQLKNHYETVCKKRKEDEKKQSSSTKKRNRKQVNTVEEPETTEDAEDSESDQESVTLCQYLYSLEKKDDALLKTSIIFLDKNKQESRVQCILDSGATCNVIGESNAKKFIGKKHLQLDDQRAVLKVFGGGKFRSLGRTIIDCVHNGSRYKAVFQVVDFEQMPLLSLKTCLQLKLIQLAPRNFYGRQDVPVADLPQADWRAQPPPGLGKSREKTVCLNPTRKLRHVDTASFLVRNPVPEFANVALSGTAGFESVPRASVVSERLGPPPLLRPVLRGVFGVVVTESPNSF